MPAKSPPVDITVANRLADLGTTIRSYRKRQRVSAASLAEAAGMSRATLERIERGAPSVTIGAWIGALAALGLDLDIVDPHAPTPVPTALPELPQRVRLDQFPVLKRLAWQLHGVSELAPADALALYERNWRHVDPAGLDDAERALVRTLSGRLGGGQLLV